MIFTNETIADGIRFYAIDSNKFKASALTFSVTLPVTRESIAYNLLLSGLLRRGTLKYPSVAELNIRLDEFYGSYVEIRSSNAGNNVSFIVSAEILDNKYVPDGTDTLGGVIDVVAQILMFPLFRYGNFNGELFEQERKILIDTLNSERNNTRSYSVRRCLELLQRDSQNPTLEELKDIAKKATLDDMRRYYENMISSAPLDVFYVGATESSTIKARIVNAFADYPCKAQTNKLNPIAAQAHRELVSSTEKMPVAQGKLTMGFNCGACLNQTDDTYYTALLLNEVFGGSASSKLFLNVREKMSLCYYCSSSYSIYTGFITVSSGIESDKLDTVKEAILDQLEQIKNGMITDDELEAAKRSLANSYTQLYDNPFDLQSFYSGRLLFEITDRIEDCRRKLADVSAQAISALAKNISLEAVFFVEGTEREKNEEVDFDE